MIIDIVVFYLLLLDSVSCNIISLFGSKKWYRKNFPYLSKVFPLVEGWALVYLALVLWVGSLLWRMGALGF